MIIPTGNGPAMTTAKRQTLADFLFYSLCSGQTKAGPYGYSPLPLNLVQAGFSQIAKLKKADPAVDLTNARRHPATTRRSTARTSSEPAGPDRPAARCLRQDRCGSLRHRHRHQQAVDRRPEGCGHHHLHRRGTTTPGAVTNAPAGPGATAIDPETGALVATDTPAASGQPVTAAATELVAARTGDTLPFAWAAAAELLVLVTAPGLYVAFLRRRRKGAL
jgi:phosphate transport system substrate-binding protein